MKCWRCAVPCHVECVVAWYLGWLQIAVWQVAHVARRALQGRHHHTGDGVLIESVYPWEHRWMHR